MLNALSDAVGGAVDAVANVGKDAVLAGLCKVAEHEIKENTGKEIEVDIVDLPDKGDWKEWMMKTGINSLCTDDTWAFLDNNQWNQRKIENWNKRDIKKIILTAKDEVEADMSDWCVCWGEWEDGSSELKLTFYPRALRWSSDAPWNGSGSKRWWILGDEISFALQLYQLPGKCFYKSDWLDDFEDVDPDGMTPFSTKKFKRWFQFRHWIIFWYSQALWGWNWAWTTKPPKNPDGSLFSLDSVLSLPSMPDLSMPSITLPSLPDIEMPSLPDMPDMPSISAPSLSAPSLSAPSLGEMPSIPDKKMRPKNRWAAHGFIELKDLKVKADGDCIIFSNANVTQFWEDKNGHCDTEQEERKRYKLKCTNEEQAKSWEESLVGSGCEVGDAGGCCTIA